MTKWAVILKWKWLMYLQLRFQMLSRNEKFAWGYIALIYMYGFVPFRFARSNFEYIDEDHILHDLTLSNKDMNTSDGFMMHKYTHITMCDYKIPGEPYTVLVKEQSENHNSDLSRLSLWREEVSMEADGGQWKPDCYSQQRVAILVPYRNRTEHLELFLNHMHAFLQTQGLEYGIFIIEQSGTGEFNRGKLFNAGYIELKKFYPNYNCLILHDVDLLPEHTGNIYSCSNAPRHMSVAVNTMRYNLLYEGIFGGVIAIKSSLFETLNGFSNLYYGWGGEDDDLSDRIMAHNMKIVRWDPKVSRYFMLSHNKEKPNPNRMNILNEGIDRRKVDGLNTIAYKLIGIDSKDKYTKITVLIDQT